MWAGSGPVTEGPAPSCVLYWSLTLGECVSHWTGATGWGGSSTSYKHLGESVSPGAGDVAFRRVERHVMDWLLKLLPVGSELLDAGLTLKVPQPDGTVVTCGGQGALKGSSTQWNNSFQNIKTLFRLLVPACYLETPNFYVYHFSLNWKFTFLFIGRVS